MIKDIKKKVKMALWVIIPVVLAVGYFSVKRWVHYELAYDGMVEKSAQEQICKMIKKEMHQQLLVDPSVCK